MGTNRDPPIVAVKWNAEERGIGAEAKANVEETLGGRGKEPNGERMVPLIQVSRQCVGKVGGGNLER